MGRSVPSPLLMLSHQFNSDPPLARGHATCQMSKCCPECSEVGSSPASCPLPAGSASFILFTAPPTLPSPSKALHPPEIGVPESRAESGVQEAEAAQEKTGEKGNGEVGNEGEPRTCPRTGQRFWECHPGGRQCRRLGIAWDPGKLKSHGGLRMP